ncbi:rhodanese-like domain-containing protein [Sphingobium aquiterrae]|uniref:rhodanese-like domain-containing protein n=1 Tax=Sphingobium aquiterrae TaxID=2038656 RepID=UPI0030180F2C
MFGFGKTKAHKEIDAQTLQAMLAKGAALLIDVREPDEFAAGHIGGAINAPLSTFAPHDLPDAAGRTIVLQCAGGKRSGMALDRCASAQASIDTHLAGGIGAWKAAGFPVERG